MRTVQVAISNGSLPYKVYSEKLKQNSKDFIFPNSYLTLRVSCPSDSVIFFGVGARNFFSNHVGLIRLGLGLGD